MRTQLLTTIIACLVLGVGTARAEVPELASPTLQSITGLPGPRLAPGTPIPTRELALFVDGVVRAAMARDHIAGVTVSIVQNGQVTLKRGYGFAGPERPVEPDRTLFRIGSISKTFTWIAVMKEVEAGRMRLDGPVNDYLPTDLAIPAVPGWRPVEVRDLMSHTPGFEDRILDHMFAETPEQIRSLPAELKLIQPKRVFEPGTTPAYSNFGVMLAGAALSHLAGASFQDVIEQGILTPLGMSRTTFREPYPPRDDLPAPMSAVLAADVSAAYRWTGTQLDVQPAEWLHQVGPAGGGSSTAGDMTRYMLMMLGDGELDGARIYAPATASAFRTPIPLPVRGGGEVDHGFFETQLPGGFIGFGHDGGTLWFRSKLLTVPALGLGIFISTNTDSGLRLTQELPQLIVEHFYAAPAGLPRSGSPELASERAVYAGTYITNRRPFSGLEKFVWLMTRQASVDVTPDGYLVTKIGADAEIWTPSGEPGRFQAVSNPQTIDFVIRNGEAVELRPHGESDSLSRVGLLYQRSVLLLVVLLAGATAVVTLVQSAIRFRAALPATRLQRRLNVGQFLAAAFWLVALGGVAVFAGGAEDESRLIFDWPGTSLLIASSSALLASLLSAGVLIALPSAWRGANGWGVWHKLWFSASSIIFCALGVQLAFWGFLEPWAA